MGLINGGMTGGGDGGGSVSTDYKFTQNESGELVLTYKNQPVSSMSPGGSWFTQSVSTGVGSLHLGGNESGGVAHSMSSCGQNVGFKNEFSKLLDGDKIFFYPTWQGVSCDGKTRYPATMRTYGPYAARNEVNGSPHESITLPYNFTLNVTGSAGSGTETYAVTVLPSENYTGKLSNIIVSNITGAEIYNTSVDVSATAGTELRIDYKYPFSALSGDNLQLRLVKEDGSYLQVRAGTTNTAIPWRALSMAVTNERVLAFGGGYTPYRLLISNASGNIAESALQNSRAVVSNSNGIPVASTTTSAEIDVISGTKTRNGVIEIADDDGFVFNDNGTMVQIAASQLWPYIQTKISGAITTAINSNLAANRNVVTTASGKLTTTSYFANRLLGTNADGIINTFGTFTPSRIVAWDDNGNFPTSTSVSSQDIACIDSANQPISRVIFDNTGVPINDRTMSAMAQVTADSFWNYIKGKLTGAISGVLTSNLTASKNVITDANGKLAVASYAANKQLVTDSNGYITTGGDTINEIVYKNSFNAAGTYTVVSGFNGGFTVSFIRTASTIYLQVTHTSLAGRYQYQTTTNNSTPSAVWTSSSGNNYPASLPAIATNGASISGWLYGLDGNGQMTSIRVDFSIITNGMSNAVVYARVS